jgi:hypothetical protein
MYEAGNEINPKKLPAQFFDNKIKDVLAKTSLEENLFNGNKKVNSELKFFMLPQLIRECITSLKIKKTQKAMIEYRRGY